MPTTMGAQSQTSTWRPPDVGERARRGGGDKGARASRGTISSSDDEKQHQDLAVDARLAQIAAHPAVEAEVDEGREGPDLFLLDEAAEDAGGQPERGVEGQREVFVVEDGGDGEHDAAQHGPAGADEQAEKNDGLKGDVGGEEVGDRDADPDAEGERHQEEGQQGEGLAVACAARRRTGAGRCGTRASTLATDATTPSLTSSVIRMSVSVTHINVSAVSSGQ